MNVPIEPRLPPHSIESEQSLLGGLLLDNSAWDRIADHVSDVDFYRDDHRRIFAHIKKLLHAGHPIDIVTVGDVIAMAGELEQCGGRAYLGDIANNTPSAANVLAYARTIRKKSDLRAEQALAVDLAALYPSGDPAKRADIISRLHGSIQTADGCSWQTPLAISDREFSSARLSPNCIVENYLWADVAQLVAPGGTGKTTFLLWEAVHICTGRPLLGREIVKRGPVVVVTAEDSRERLIARLRSIGEALQLTQSEWASVRDGIFISDVSGTSFRLTEVVGDVVTISPGVDSIIRACKRIHPVMIEFDPMVSFGVGESRVNDGEQGLIVAARALRNSLNCCVRFVHHTGKQNARDKSVDQYAGRNGSALADGARMVSVLQPMSETEWADAVGYGLQPGETAIRLALPKTTFSARQPDILIKRNGYAFTHCLPVSRDPARLAGERAEQVMHYIVSEFKEGRRHSKNSLEGNREVLGLSRPDVRSAIARLELDGRIEGRKLETSGRGGLHAFLCPIGSPESTNQGGEPIAGRP